MTICLYDARVIIFLLFLSMIGCSKSPTKSPEGMALIPSGEFKMGIDEPTILYSVMSDKLEGKDATPMHNVYVDSFYMDIYEVTYKQYAAFKPQLKKYIIGKERFPVSGISWSDSDKFCRNVGKRLPTESEWEKGARGTDGRLYTWGNNFDSNNANLSTNLMLVGSIREDRSPFGIYDMVGNVSEWTSSIYEPYKGSDYKADIYEKKYHVARGGSFSKNEQHNYKEIFSQVIFRHPMPTDNGAFDNGFRCVRGL